MDLNYTGDTTSGREGIDLLSRVQAIDRELPIVVMTGWGSVDIAVEAMRRGVRNFVQKPWDNAQLVAILRTEVEAGRTRRQQVAIERRDLDEARRIQRKLLPSTMPPIEGWEIAVSWQPASGVGGDCFDAIAFGPGRVGLSIADVVGKGIPAALLMSNLQAAVRAFATDTTEPAELCQQVNRILCGHIAEGRFISFFYCIIDSDESTLTFANAGHYPPILVRADGSVERLAVGGAVLGVFPEGGYEQGTRCAPQRRSHRPLHRRHHRRLQRCRRGVRRRPAGRPGRGQSELQRSRTAGPAGRRRRRVLGWPFSGRCDADRHGGRIISQSDGTSDETSYFWYQIHSCR